MINIMSESSWRRKGFIFRYILEPAMKGSQVRNWSRDHDREHITCFLSMAYSACFLMWTRITCSAMAPPTIGWALRHQLLIKNMPHPHLATGQSDGGIFFPLRFSLPQRFWFVSRWQKLISTGILSLMELATLDCRHKMRHLPVQEQYLKWSNCGRVHSS